MARKNKLFHKSFRFETVFFDWDGCLADSLEVWVQVIEAGLRERGITSVSRADIVSHTIVKFENAKKLGITDIYEFGTAVNRVFAERISEVTLAPYAKEVLRMLKTYGVTTILITTSGRTAIDRCLQKFSLQDCFDHTITYEDVTHHKPHPEGIYQGLTATGSDPSRTIIVGDTRNDILAGKRAGIATCVYFPPPHETVYDKDHLLALGADYYIRDLREVLQIVERPAAGFR